jgi:hypothetical protein
MCEKEGVDWEVERVFCWPKGLRATMTLSSP